MSVARAGQTATSLSDGDVLVAGGGTSSAELYDSASGAFVSAGSMSVARTDAVAVLLGDGDVLVAGGERGNKAVNSAELYNPNTGQWSLTGSMNVARASATATLLPDGDVLVAGGACNGQAYGCDAGSYLTNLRSAELYDPANGTWSMTGSMRFGRDDFTATLLPDGDVLAAGGFATCDDDFCSDLRKAELYHPSTGKWTPTGSMSVSREQHTATLLPDGQVLVAGGLNEGGFGPGAKYASAELYEPTTGKWTTTGSMAVAHVGATATLLTNGWVLVAGGGTSTAQIFEPQPGIWVSPGVMSTVRTDHTATLLADGHVLVTGGTGPDGQPQATAEVFLAGPGPLVTVTPATLSFGAQQVGTSGGSQMYTVANDGSANLSVSGVSIFGDHPSDFVASTDCSHVPVKPGGTCTVAVHFAPTGTGLRSAEVGVVDNAPISPQAVTVSGYGAGPNAWAPTGSMATARDEFTSTLLSDGDVLVAGGAAGVTGNGLASVELYNPTTGTFSATGSLEVGRFQATATLLPDGDVLVAGGRATYDDVLSSAELYNPTAASWSTATPMNEPGYDLTSTVLPDGDVLVTGFAGPAAELYNPGTATWTDTPAVPGYFTTATLLQDGDVLATGGTTAAAALYTPGTNTWATTGSMNVARLNPSATLLPDGDVLVAGGMPSGQGEALASAELYDPTKGTWALTSSMGVGRSGQTATLLTDGLVLVTGGCTTYCEQGLAAASSEVYNDGYWYFAAPMTTGRYEDAATLLADGNVLAVGGVVKLCCDATASAEVYTSTLLAVSPASGPVGQAITISGSGFFAGEVVKVRWDYSGKALASAKTSDTGTFVVHATVPASPTGAQTISAIGQRSFAGATATFDVTT